MYYAVLEFYRIPLCKHFRFGLLLHMSNARHKFATLVPMDKSEQDVGNMC